MRKNKKVAYKYYAARDADRSLYIYTCTVPPVRGESQWNHASIDEPLSLFELPMEAFPELTWENDPMEIQLVDSRRNLFLERLKRLKEHPEELSPEEEFELLDFYEKLYNLKLVAEKKIIQEYFK